MYELGLIKKHYGEDMMHFCRENFATILQQERLLLTILEANFTHNKYLYKDIISQGVECNFKNYIYSYLEPKYEKAKVDKTPKELLDELGYVLYECKSEEDIQSFKKYYAKGEELCTFKDGRLDKCHVFFAVKKNIDDIKREDYSEPSRQDIYGTSIISIQFAKGDVNTLSIKNRYNHTVKNPDATFGNNLENIIPGLTNSFEEEYHLNINSNLEEFELTDYVLAKDGRYYKYNYELNNIYYCMNNIIIDNGEVITDYMQNERYIIIDYFILDLQEKRISLYDDSIPDSFVSRVKNIERIDISKDRESGDKNITIKTLDGNIGIVISKYNKIIEYCDDIAKDIEDNFFTEDDSIKSITLYNTESIGDNFLSRNFIIEEIYIYNVKEIGNNFLYCSNYAREVYLKSVETIGDYFMYCNPNIEGATLPNVKNIGNAFCFHAKKMKEIYIPEVITIGDNFITSNNKISTIELPNVLHIGSDFLRNNDRIEVINYPNVIMIGSNFCEFNRKNKSVYMPNVETVGANFLTNDTALNVFYAPNLENIGDRALYYNILYGNYLSEKQKVYRMNHK